MTKRIDDILSQEQMALKQVEANAWFGNYQTELGSRIINDGNLKSDYLVKNFESGLAKQPEVRRQLNEIAKVSPQKQIPKQPTPQKIHQQAPQPVRVVSFHDETIPQAQPMVTAQKQERQVTQTIQSTPQVDFNRAPINTPTTAGQFQNRQLIQPNQFQSTSTTSVNQQNIQQPQQPKQVSTNQINQLNRPTPSKTLVPGQASEAQISPNSTEVILKYNPKQPIITHISSINLPLESKITTMRALDSRNIAIGTKNGDLSLVDTGGKFETISYSNF